MSVKNKEKYILHIINDAYCQSIIKGRDILKTKISNKERGDNMLVQP